MENRGDTLSQREDPRGVARRLTESVFLEVECDRPLVGPACHSLEGIDRVAIGRASERELHDSAGRVLTIGVPDRWMSVSHAELRRAGAEWTVHDLGSKNGTLVQGRRIGSAALPPEGRIQAGHTLFCLRRHGTGGSGISIDVSNPSPVSDSTTFSASFAEVLTRAEAVATADVSVLLHGETGTGKEVLAHAVHRWSRRPGPFVAVNCGAIPQTLVESELFGHRKGSFSGASQNRVGLVQASDGGTLFLDEIADLSLASQAALLRVLQEHEVLPIGALRPESVDLRVIAASHQPLDRLVRDGKFREDLLARLTGVVLEIPPLRERMEDLPLLIASLLRSMTGEERVPKLSPEAALGLLEYSWPLNVRELEQALRGGLALCGPHPIGLDHLPDAVRRRGAIVDESLEGEDLERRDRLVQLLQEHRGNLSAVARSLGKGRTQVSRWLGRYGLSRSAFRGR